MTPGPTPPPPSQDAFYRAPKHLDSLTPGTVIRTRQVSIPGIDRSKLAVAKTVLFVSTDINDNNIAASETLLTPAANWPGAQARPMLAVQQTYDSLGTACEPSYTLRVGGKASQDDVSVLNNLLAGGSEVVVPDYEGPTALFTIGDQEGRIVLDGIRAAESTGAGGINAATRVASFGYSGGGQATAWGAELQPSYAPGINLVGAAEGGVPADMKETLGRLDGGPNAFLAVMSLVAIGRAYPDLGLNHLLTSAGKKLVTNVATTCGDLTLRSDLEGTRLDSLVTVPSLLAYRPLQPILAALQLGQHAPSAPIYNFHGTADEIVGFAADRKLVQYYCSQNVTVDFAPIQNAKHLEAYYQGIAGVASWLIDRLNGKPAPNNCQG